MSTIAYSPGTGSESSVFTNKWGSLYIVSAMFQRLDRYILKELIGPFLLGILILTFILIMQQILNLMELVLDKGVDLRSVGELFLHLLPSFFLITIPMAVLMSTVTTFNRLSADNEIISLQAGGIGFYRLLRPVFIFAILVSLLTLLMGLNAPTSKGASKKLALKLLLKRASLGLEERRFNGVFPNMMIYVDSMPTFSKMEGVFIYDQRNRDMPTLIVAEKGVLINDEKTKTLRLHLTDGSLQQKEKSSDRYERMVFASYDLKINLHSLAQKQGGTEDLSYSEIKQRLIDSQGNDIASLRLLSDFYKRYLFSLAAFVFCLLGMPLGVLSGLTTRLGGFSAGICIIVFYYILMTFSDYLVSIKIIPPLVAASLPLWVLIPFGFFLFKKVANKASPALFGFTSKRP